MAYDVENFAAEVIDRSQQTPVLVDFWASWCAPCRILGPVLERLAGENGGAWALAKVDTEKHQDVASAYNIRSIPDVKLFHRGKVIAEFSGAMPEYMIVRWLQEHLPGAHADALEKARTLVLQSRPAEASAILENVLRREPANLEGRTALARLILFDDPVRACTLVSGIDEPKFAEAVGTVSTLCRLLSPAVDETPPAGGKIREVYLNGIDFLRKREFESALETFIDVIRNDRYYDNDGSRKACIAIFKYLGEEHPLTTRFRREFSSALY